MPDDSQVTQGPSWPTPSIIYFHGTGSIRLDCDGDTRPTLSLSARERAILRTLLVYSLDRLDEDEEQAA